jgi:hypothetical protein
MMTTSFEKQVLGNAEIAKKALEAFLSTKGSLTEIRDIPRSLVESMQDTLAELEKWILDMNPKPTPEPKIVEEPEPRQDPPARSLEGKILRDIRNGKEVTGEGDSERKKAFNWLSRNGFIRNTGSRRYPHWEAIEAE